MSLQDFQTNEAALRAIKPEDVKTPSMPVEVYTQESEDLYVWAMDDRTALEARGLDWALAASIPSRAGALRETQSQWAKDFKSKEQLEREWAIKAPQAFELRDMLLHAFRYAYRNDPALLTNVAAIAEGASREDMIQDLNDLSVLGKANTAPLAAINLDLTTLDQAAETSGAMAELLAGVKKEKEETSGMLDLRNRAYTYLKQAVDELKACGKYVFWNNEDRLKGYRSAYIHKYKKRRSNGETGNTASDNAV